MKKLSTAVLALALVGSLPVAVFAAQGQKRSIPHSTRVVDLQKGDQILITDHLEVQSGTFDNISTHESATGLSFSCYFGTNGWSGATNAGFPAGHKLNVSQVLIETSGLMRFVTVETDEGYSINCLGGPLVKRISVGRVENLLNENIKFIRPVSSHHTI